MARAVRKKGANQHLYSKATSYENFVPSELDGTAPLARFVYRIRLCLKQELNDFGKSPRQDKKKRKFENRWRFTLYNHRFEELIKCLSRG